METGFCFRDVFLRVIEIKSTQYKLHSHSFAKTICLTVKIQKTFFAKWLSTSSMQVAQEWGNLSKPES